MSYHIDTKRSAVALRRKGESLLSISRTLDVAKSTVALWVQDVHLPKHLQAILIKHSTAGGQKGNQFQKAKRLKDDEILFIAAKKDASLLKRTSEFWRITAAFLYWCEGGKHESSSGIQFTNSDPELVKVFLYALRKGYHLDEAKFRVLMHLHTYHHEDVQKIFWGNVTKISKMQFQKTYQKSNTGKRKHPNYQGCIAIKYYDVRIVRSLKFLYTSFAQSL